MKIKFLNLAGDYQQANYEKLKFWQSYRGLAIIVFIFSWLLSLWLFSWDLFAIIFWALIYSLVLFFVYEGRTWAMFLLFIFWLLEKINNWWLNPWSLLVFLLLGVIWVFLLYRALRLEILRGRKAYRLQHKKIGLIIFSLVGVFILLQLWGAILFWSPFIQQSRAWQITATDVNTQVLNKNFSVSFTLPANCRLDSEIFDQLGANYQWAGKIFCHDYDDYILLLVTENNLDLADFAKINDNFYWRENSDTWDIVIVRGESKLLLGGYQATLDLKNIILETIKSF